MESDKTRKSKRHTKKKHSSKHSLKASHSFPQTTAQKSKTKNRGSRHSLSLNNLPQDEEITIVEDLEKSIESNDVGEDMSDAVAFIICDQIVEDFWNTSWEVCHSRFVYENEASITISDLRDTWLSIVNQNWMDTDLLTSGSVKLPTEFSQADVPPLPPKFDCWSHGALEVLPNKCRESVLDPFIREKFPFPWITFGSPSDSVDDDNGEDMADSEDHDVEVEADDEGESEEQAYSWEENDYARKLPRPKSPANDERTRSTSSIDAALGSVHAELNLDSWGDTPTDKVKKEENVSDFTSTLNGTDILTPVKNEKSMEILYQSSVTIKSSSELVYKMSDHKESEYIAFRLPNQTSSEAVKMFASEKEKRAARKSKTSLRSEETPSQPQQQQLIGETDVMNLK